jgi:hypothetical protein
MADGYIMDNNDVDADKEENVLNQFQLLAAAVVA